MLYSEPDPRAEVLSVLGRSEALTVPQVRDRLALPTAQYCNVRDRLVSLEREGKVQRVGTAWRRL
jgi:hypothetical protein